MQRKGMNWECTIITIDLLREKDRKIHRNDKARIIRSHLTHYYYANNLNFRLSSLCAGSSLVHLLGVSLGCPKRNQCGKVSVREFAFIVFRST